MHISCAKELPWGLQIPQQVWTELEKVKVMGGKHSVSEGPRARSFSSLESKPLVTASSALPPEAETGAFLLIMQELVFCKHLLIALMWIYNLQQECPGHLRLFCAWAEVGLVGSLQLLWPLAALVAVHLLPLVPLPQGQRGKPLAFHSPPETPTGNWGNVSDHLSLRVPICKYATSM